MRHLRSHLIMLFLLAVGASTLQAKQITAWQAQQFAYDFWAKQMPQKAKAKSQLVNLPTRSSSEANDAYFVFNNDAGGFFIVSGDDAVTPILGYATQGKFDPNNNPSPLKSPINTRDSGNLVKGEGFSYIFILSNRIAGNISISNEQGLFKM